MNNTYLNKITLKDLILDYLIEEIKKDIKDNDAY